ncbi:MAG TPA: acyl-CoA dehydrogenase family protein [Burkholderiaceae bacterium]|nr:acyl-CoA dehydrogenase family protein [Burkholderiaceae bacterium]
MNFVPDDDLRALQSAIERLVAAHPAMPLDGARHGYAAALDRQLEEGGFFETLQVEGLGRVGAASMIIELSRSPLCVEMVASSLLRPRFFAGLPRPCAVLWDDPARPARFLPVARSAVLVSGDGVRAADLPPGCVAELDSVFAYPMGRLKEPPSLHWRTLDVDAAALRDHWQVGIAAEITGCLAAALQSVVEHVKLRRQFGRPLGAFQAIQHRLAEAATAIEAARWLTLRAAWSCDPLDASMALAHAQHHAGSIVYDLHQFMGATGLTLEHPLHRWTYRVRLLRSELGGAERQFAATARAAWSVPVRSDSGAGTGAA